MSLRVRKELLSSLAPRYVKAGRRKKRTILDEFTAATGYHRKSAIRLLTNPGRASSHSENVRTQT